METQTETRITVNTGFNAFVCKSLRLTFKPSPTIAAVNNHVVMVEIPSNTPVDTGMETPNT